MVEIEDDVETRRGGDVHPTSGTLRVRQRVLGALNDAVAKQPIQLDAAIAIGTFHNQPCISLEKNIFLYQILKMKFMNELVYFNLKIRFFN